MRVLFTQAQMKQYRLPFFTKLHAALLSDGIEVKVAYSDPPEADRQKQDNVDLPAEMRIKVPGYWFFGNKILYQALLRQALAADLVVAEQANRNLQNYLLLSLHALRVKRLAFFGHGGNRGRTPSRFSEWIRPWIARRADWWFTYTDGTATWLAENGVGPEKVTVVQNAIDTRAFTAQIMAISDGRVQRAREQLGIAPGSPVGIYCGILTADKGITLLLEAARLIRERIPNFHLVILGGGPERAKVQQAASTSDWIHYVGPQFGEEKALFFRVADLCLLPGYVGLAILDGFAAGLPVVTVSVPFHSPEIEYLEDGFNGRLTADSVESCAETVVDILSCSPLLEKLKAGARVTAERFSIEAMVENCRQGILRCLAHRLGTTEGTPESDVRSFG